MDIAPLTPATYAERAAGNVPAWALEAAKTVAEADRLVVVGQAKLVDGSKLNVAGDNAQ